MVKSYRNKVLDFLVDHSKKLVEYTKENHSPTDGMLVLFSMLEMTTKELIKTKLIVEKSVKIKCIKKKKTTSYVLFKHIDDNSFYENIELCLALGLIDKGEQKKMHKLRKFRNDFIHKAMLDDYSLIKSNFDPCKDLLTMLIKKIIDINIS